MTLRDAIARARPVLLALATVVATACAPLPTTGPPPPEPIPASAPLPAPPPEPARPHAATPGIAAPPEADEDFEGQYRAAAKTSLVRVHGALAPVESFDDLPALKAFLRPQIDPLMRHRHPHLSETDAGHRLPEEQHLVAVDAWLHAVKHETGPHGDRDFHVMLGSSPTPGEGIFMTAEASGLPAGGPDRALLLEARRELLALVGPCRCDGRFQPVSPPRPVRVTGALFFDGAHAIGAVGPAYAKPFTVWEIHPILSIERLDRGAATGAPGAAPPPSARTPAAPAPSDARTPTARCRDGSDSYAKSHAGACSGHHGVAEWLR